MHRAWVLILTLLAAKAMGLRPVGSNNIATTWLNFNSAARRTYAGALQASTPGLGGAAGSSSRNESRSILAPSSSSGSTRLPDSTALSKGIIPTSHSDLANLERQFGLSAGGVRDGNAPPRSATALRYFQIVDKLAPNEMLQKFAMSAPPNVQEAAKSTIMSILGQLPNYALDASLITTSTKLANLIYQMQLTGYSIKNAEYRMSLTRSLKGLPRLPPPAAIPLNQGNMTIGLARLSETEVSGTATIRDALTGLDLQVDVSELTGSLSKEIEALRNELAVIRDNRETELRTNLLTYIQALPERELSRLTSDMSDDVMESINMLVQALMERLGISNASAGGPEVVIQQSMAAMAQLCMWQLIVGYKLRELEAMDRPMSLDCAGLRGRGWYDRVG